jgi:hypothetical protein
VAGVTRSGAGLVNYARVTVIPRSKIMTDNKSAGIFILLVCFLIIAYSIYHHPPVITYFFIGAIFALQWKRMKFP